MNLSQRRIMHIMYSFVLGRQNIYIIYGSNFWSDFGLCRADDCIIVWLILFCSLWRDVGALTY